MPKTTHRTLYDASEDPLPNRGNSNKTFADLRENVFKRVVEDNPLVCSVCFTRLRSREERPNTPDNRTREEKSSFLEREIPPPDPDESFTWEGDWRLYTTNKAPERLGRDYTPSSNGPAPIPEFLEEEYEDEPQYPGWTSGGKATYCKTCGSLDRDFDGSKTKLEAARAADSLSHTLREYAIPHDWRYLPEAVVAMKAIRPMSGLDRQIFRTATDEAVQLALTAHSPETSFTPSKTCEDCGFTTDGPTTDKFCPACNGPRTDSEDISRLYYRP